MDKIIGKVWYMSQERCVLFLQKITSYNICMDELFTIR